MRKSLAIVAVLAVLFSCSKEPDIKVQKTSDNQRWIKERYNKINFSPRTNTDSLKYFSELLYKASKNESDDYKAMAVIVEGLYFANSSSYELALKKFEQALQISNRTKNDSLVAKSLLSIGNYYKNTGKYPEAFSKYYKALKIYETSKNKNGISVVNANIGQVYQQKGDLESATEHLKVAMEVLKEKKESPIYLFAAHSLANVYGMKGEIDEALAIDEEGIRIGKKKKSDYILSTFYDNKANCMMFTNRLDSAQYYFNECLKLDIKTGNKKQIADSYSNLAQLAIFKRDFATAEKEVFKSIEILKDIKHKHNLAKSYSILADVYAQQKKYDKAFAAHKTFYDEYKSLIDDKKEASLAEFKIVYDTQKKEKQLAENKVELLQNEADARQKNVTITILSILAFFIATVGFLIFRQQRLKSRQQEQEFKLKTAISQIETQNKLQEQRLSISRDLHDNIGAQLTFIISSVDTVKYGFDVQNSKLGTKLDSISDFTKSTIIELRDTIWAMNNNQISFEDLRARIFNFIEKAKIAKEDIQFKFNIENELNPLKLSSIQGINIYRTIQEALNNAIKYAEATVVEILAKEENGTITIQISDNGKGFDIANAELGNGLQNMRKRIEDIDGNFRISSAEGKGTTITVLITKSDVQ